jgi:hypothetical protein
MRNGRMVRVVPGATSDRQDGSETEPWAYHFDGFVGIHNIPGSSPSMPASPTVVLPGHSGALDSLRSNGPLFDDLSRHRGVFRVLTLLRDRDSDCRVGVSRYWIRRRIRLGQVAVNGALDCAVRNGLVSVVKESVFPFGSRYGLTARGVAFVEYLSRP